MAKKIAVVNDLSGFGRCSLTAAIPVIAAMGVQPCPLPTAVLSAQTGYPSYFIDDYTEKMENIYMEWRKMGVRFDGIYTGFLSDVGQIRRTEQFLDIFHGEDTFLLVDPVMGDNGARFGIFSEEFQYAMRELVCRADIITPNLTELCLLAGEDCRLAGEGAAAAGEMCHCETKSGFAETGKMGKGHITNLAGQMARDVMAQGPSEIVVTGIRFVDEESGKEMMGNLAVTGKGAELFAAEFIGESYSGTGDLFASVIAGGRARDFEPAESVKLAQKFVGAAIRDAVRKGVPRNEGVEFERHLGMLVQGDLP